MHVSICTRAEACGRGLACGVERSRLVNLPCPPPLGRPIDAPHRRLCMPKTCHETYCWARRVCLASSLPQRWGKGGGGGGAKPGSWRRIRLQIDTKATRQGQSALTELSTPCKMQQSACMHSIATVLQLAQDAQQGNVHVWLCVCVCVCVVCVCLCVCYEVFVFWCECVCVCEYQCAQKSRKARARNLR